jgi:hypothetical protein
MMGDIDAARKKEGKKKPKQLCMRLSPSKTFHTKTMKKKKKRKRKKKKRGGQYNATISSPAGLQLDQKLKIKQQLQSAATGNSKQASKQQRFRNSGNQKTKD